jgi:hypothetical protein
MTGGYFPFHNFDFAPAKILSRKNHTGSGSVPAHPARPERGVHAASTHARQRAQKISNALARSDVEAG